MYSRSSPRRRHDAEFKTRVLAACDEPGASISGVALAHDLNANLVRQWRVGRGTKLIGRTSGSPAPGKAPGPTPLLGADPEFVAIEMPASAKTVARVAADQAEAMPLIHIELRRGPVHLNVRWPSSAAGDCTAWLRELSSGMFK